LHVGGIRTEVTLDLAKHAADIGADAMVAVAPIFYGMHDDALAAYYVSIAEAAPDVPLFGYDVPHMAVNGIGGPLAIRLCAEIPSLAGIKSSNKDAQVVRRQIDALPADRIILVGSESIALGSMALGADGMISGLSTAVPEPFVAMLSAFASGNMIEARRMQKLINRLLACMPAGARIGGIKAILAERGIPVGSPVAPLPSPDREIWPPMRSILAR
jgi:dihydrodipicolinate synthase/N-acetylneuraminate lyase